MCQIKNCGCNIPNNPVICLSYQPNESCEDRSLTVSNTEDALGYSKVSMITPEVNQISAYKEHLEFVNSPEPLSGIKNHVILRLTNKFLTYVTNIFRPKNVGTGAEIYKGVVTDPIEGVLQTFRKIKSENTADILITQNPNDIEFQLGRFAQNMDLDDTHLKLKDQDDNILADKELTINNIKNLQNSLNQLSLGITGVLKVDSLGPATVGLFKLVDVGTYTNLVPIIPYGSTTPTNTPITTQTGYDNMVFWDGTNYTQLRTQLSYNIDVEDGALSYDKGYENIRNTFNVFSSDKKNPVIVKFNQGNFYIDYGGNLQPNPDTVLSESINCEGHRFLLTNLVMTNSGFIVFRDENNTIVKYVHVTQSELGKIIPVPAAAKTVQLCAYINNPVYGDAPTALLYGESSNNADFSEKQIEGLLKTMYKTPKIVYFDRDKNYFLNSSALEVPNPDCIATDFIDCFGLKYVLPYFNIYTEGNIIFYDENYSQIYRAQVPVGDEFKLILIPETAYYVRFSAFDFGTFSNILNPYAFIIGDKIDEDSAMLINRAAYPKKLRSYNSWATTSPTFIKIALPDINYIGGFFYDFTVTITDIPNIIQNKEDSVFKFRTNLLAYPNSIKYFAQKLYGNNNKVSMVRLMRDADNIPCLIINLNSPLNVYNVEVKDVTAFAPTLMNNYAGKDIITNLTITNETSISGYNLIYNFTSDLLIVGTGIQSVQPGTNVTIDTTDPNNPIINAIAGASNPFINKNILLLGDSITAGYNNGIELDTYPDFIKTKFITPNVIKYGASGGTIAINPSWSIHILSDARLSYVVSQAPDVILLMAGVNDYQTNMPIGTISSGRDTTIGSLKYAIEYLLTALPNVKILYCTSGGYYYQPNFGSTRQSGRVQNTIGNDLRAYFDACIELCKKYSIPTLDYNAECSWLDRNEVTPNYTSDGLHFATKAYDELTSMQLNKLRTKFV